MLCQICNKEDATVYVTKVINNQKTELHICKNCANQKDHLTFSSSFTLHNLLSGLLDMYGEQGLKTSFEASTQCNNCGMTYNKFRQIGKLGCDQCYKAFQPRLLPLFKRIHGDTHHNGKIPKKAGNVIRLKKESAKLKNMLNQAVANEEFERAAVLRDQIKELEKQVNKED